MFRKNALVLYKNEPALVTEISDEKITIAHEKNGSNETLRVREKDIALLHPGPLESLGAALNAAGYRQRRNFPLY